MAGLEGFFDDTSTPEVTPATDPAPATPAETEGDPKPTEPEGDKPTEEAKVVPLAEHVKLRESRREARERAAELEKQIAFLQGKQTAAQPEPENQEALNDAFLEAPIKSAERIAEEKAWQLHVSLSQDLMRQQHKDYDAMESVFRDMAAKDQSLGVGLRQSPNPARFAYETAKRSVSPAETPEQMEARITKEITAKLEEEAKKAKADSAAESFSGTQAGATGGSAQGGEDVPMDLSSILPTKEFNTT